MIAGPIDVHCHLEDPAFDSNRGEVLARAREAGVVAVVTSGLGPEAALKTLDISDNRFVYPTLGVAPYELAGYEEVYELIIRERARIVGIGEVGLDYYHGRAEDRAEQVEVFTRFVRLAQELGLPLIVHSRSAGRHALDILFREKAEPVVMHAFDGRSSYALKAVEKGFFFSIPPSVVRSRQKQKLVKALPLESLLLESDAPVLGPDPQRLNEPKNILVSARAIAEIKRSSEEVVVDCTSRLSRDLFRL